jgi:hypothetical protein
MILSPQEVRTALQALSEELVGDNYVVARNFADQEYRSCG